MVILDVIRQKSPLTWKLSVGGEELQPPGFHSPDAHQTEFLLCELS